MFIDTRRRAIQPSLNSAQNAYLCRALHQDDSCYSDFLESFLRKTGREESINIEGPSCHHEIISLSSIQSCSGVYRP